MVEIKVDTKKDSRHDIKKAIAFLQQFLEETTVSSPSDDAQVSPGGFNLFSDNDDGPSPEGSNEEEACHKGEH